MKERLIEFLAHLGISQGAFEKKVGLSNGFVNNVGDSIRTKSLNKIIAVYPDLNTAWLIVGEGEMLKSTVKPSADLDMERLWSIIDSQKETIKSHGRTIETQARTIESQQRTIERLSTPGAGADVHDVGMKTGS